MAKEYNPSKPFGRRVEVTAQTSEGDERREICAIIILHALISKDTFKDPKEVVNEALQITDIFMNELNKSRK